MCHDNLSKHGQTHRKKRRQTKPQTQPPPQSDAWGVDARTKQNLRFNLSLLALHRNLLIFQFSLNLGILTVYLLGLDLEIISLKFELELHIRLRKRRLKPKGRLKPFPKQIMKPVRKTYLIPYQEVMSELKKNPPP